MKSAGIALTKKELATVAGYTYRRLYDIDMMLPKEEKLFVRSEADDKKFDLAVFVQRWVAYNRQASEEENEELSVIKAQHERVKKEKTEIEVARMRSEYVPAQDVQRLWTSVAALVQGRFVSMGKKLAPALAGMRSPDEIEAAIDREVRDALTMIADAPMPGDERFEPREEGETGE